MKKKKAEIKELSSLSISDLTRKVESIRKEIALSRLEFSANKPKDTNVIARKKRLLARLLTIISNKNHEKNIKG